MLAPLIKPIKTQGGTFYTFSSASEDLGLSFNDSQKKFRFSNFALLNLPTLGNPELGENSINLSNTPGGFSEIDGSKSLNDYLTESFQNYCLNLEAIASSSEEYDINVDRSISERVFYKWLKEIGAIRFREAIVGEELVSTLYGSRFTEENESPIYSRVIKYIGEINILNSIKGKENSFTEVYVYVPTSHGNTPTVLFSSIEDANYKPNQVFINNPDNPLNAEYLYGRGVTTIHPSGLSLLSYYDSDTSTFNILDPVGANSDFYYYNPTLNDWIKNDEPGFSWWFSNPIANSYFTEPGGFGDVTNDKFKIESVNKSVEFVRSRLDGISLEFNTDVYADIKLNGKGTDFGTYSESNIANSFDFNTILLYYDLYDPITGISSTTNLFGVLFLDNVDPLQTGGGYIPSLTKYKPNSLTGDNGNSYAFRINLKFDVNTQDTVIETSINDYNPYSLELYMDALNRMTSAYNIMLENNSIITALTTEVEELKSLIFTEASIQEIDEKYNTLAASFENNKIIFENNKNLVELINRNYEEITNIYKNYTSVKMSYNLDLLNEGDGIYLDKSEAGSIKIVNRNQSFNIGTNPLISIGDNFTINPSSFSYVHKLINYSNYVKITDGTPDTPYQLDRDIILYINDADFSWKKGQSLRITFKYGLDLSNTNGNFNFILYTDSKDLLNRGFPYSAEAGYITYLDFENKGNSPIIEIICIDPASFTFVTDVY